MVDPTNPYSYLNYLREQNRLYEFYFYEEFFIPRREYNDYCRWVADQLRPCASTSGSPTCARTTGCSSSRPSIR